MEAGISSGEESSDDEESPFDGFDTTIKGDSGWSDIEATSQVPPLSLKHIHEYFIKRRLRKEQVTATKPFEKGYRIFAARKVHSVAIHHVSQTSLYCIIRAAVIPTEKVRQKAYTTAVALNKQSATVLYGQCTCIAGKGASCNHIAALLFALDEYNREIASQGNGKDPSCTSLPSAWSVPPKAKLDPTPVKDLVVVKPKYGKSQANPTITPCRPTDDNSAVTIDRIMKLRRDLQETYQSTLLFHTVWPEQADPVQVRRLQLQQQSSSTSSTAMSCSCNEE